MTFVSERIPESEKQKITFPVDTRPDGSKPTLARCAIDRDRSAFIVLVNSHGGAYEGTPVTNYYNLSWQGEVIQISATPLDKTFSEERAVMSWRVHSLKIPSGLETNREEIMQIIRDAFSAVGEFFNGERFASVNVEFDLPLH